jgi:ABC-type branched-subunit amino acid transport system substrate-binding protein
VPIAHSLPESALLAEFRSVATLSSCFINDAAWSRTFRVIKATGGKVVEIVRLPLNTADFSSALLQAQSSGRKVVALANGGADTTASIRQATEFGIEQDGKQRLAGLLLL